MSLDDLKEQMKEQFQTLWGQIQENSAFIQLREKYQNLTPNHQKLVILGGVVMGFIAIFFIPFTYYFASMDSLGEYEENKQTIRELFKVNRQLSQAPPAPAAMTFQELKPKIEGELNTSGLLAEQIIETHEASLNEPGVPPPIEQHGVEVKLSKLTVQQLTDIGYKLQSISDGIRMLGIEVTATPNDNHYFDVTYRLASYTLPPLPEEPEEKKKDKK